MPLTPPPSIHSLEQALIRSFLPLKGDPSLLLDHLIELGRSLSPLPSGQKSDARLVRGCLSRVWISHSHERGRLWLQGDSEAAITKGILWILIHLFSGQYPREILSADFSFFAKTGIKDLLGIQRRGGIDHMVAKIQGYTKRYSDL